MVRVLIAGVVGGLIVFFAAAIDRTVFRWGTRTFGRLHDETATIEFFRSQGLRPGTYVFPQLPDRFDTLPDEVQKTEGARIAAAYTEGPAAFVVVAPTGQDMMGPHKLIAEAATSVGAAIMIAWMVAQATTAGLFKRWLMCVIFAVAAWLSLVASFAIWHDFPGSYVHDELFCAVFEWALAGLAIAVIVKPTTAPIMQPGRPA